MCASIGARKDSCARSPLGCDRRSVIHLVVAATAKGGESHEATAVTGSAVLSEALIFSPNEVLAVAARGNEACGFSHAFRQHAAHGEISAFGRIVRAGAAAQCKDLHA